jgi:hypothetical protein
MLSIIDDILELNRIGLNRRDTHDEYGQCRFEYEDGERCQKHRNSKDYCYKHNKELNMANKEMKSKDKKKEMKHKDAKEDKKMMNKMVKKDCMK